MKLRNGFTLIELLVVMTIIAILAGIVLVNLGNVRQRGRDARRIAELKQVQSALESYYASSIGNQSYPSVSGGAAIARWCALQTELRRAISGLTLPVDPTSSGSCEDGNLSAARDLAYDYFGSSDRQGYILAARLEDPTNAELKRDLDGLQLGTVDCGGGDPESPPVYCLRQP